MKFEQDTLNSGVVVQSYHSDNGVFTAKEFMKELAEKGQGIMLSSASVQFQNGTWHSAMWLTFGISCQNKIQACCPSRYGPG